MRKIIRLFFSLFFPFVLVVNFSSLSLGAEVLNGDFESGNLTNWQTTNNGSGEWLPYSGSSGPLTGKPIYAPPEGTYGATTDQFGPGSHILYQDITLEENQEHLLSFYYFYQNEAGDFHPLETLALTSPNQQYRIDILDPNAPVNSVNSQDIWLTLFRTESGDPLNLEPTLMEVDLTDFAGLTIRLRFASVEMIGYMRTGVDDVRIESENSEPPNQPPTVEGHLEVLRTYGPKTTAFKVGGFASDPEDGALTPTITLFALNQSGERKEIVSLSYGDLLVLKVGMRKIQVHFHNEDPLELKGMAASFEVLYEVTDSEGLYSSDLIIVD